MDPEVTPQEQTEETTAQADELSTESVESLETTPEPAADEEAAPVPVEYSEADLKAIIEAVIYITEEPLEPKQIAAALGQDLKRVEESLAKLVAEYAEPGRGLQIREIAGGYKMATKPEHHEAVRQFVKNLKPGFKLTPAALETLAVIAYKQPITAPEIMEIRGVQGGGVLKTLLDRKLITTAGRKNVIGKPILYKTTKDFLVQFGLKSTAELPTLKEFEELRRLAFTEDEVPEGTEGPASIAEAAEQQTAEAPEQPTPSEENPVTDTAAEA